MHLFIYTCHFESSIEQNFFFSIPDFFCLRRSGLVIGVRENGLDARPNFLYAGKSLAAPLSFMVRWG